MALTAPFAVELIWSYWHEEGMLVQTLNHILARFQNRRTGPGPDPMARFDLSPLRPLRNLLFEWAEDESDRLTVRRRAAEYEYEYGLSLVGRAVPRAGLFVESRTTFIQAFHQLLHTALPVLPGGGRHHGQRRRRSRCSTHCGRPTWCSPRARTTSTGTCRRWPGSRC